MSVEIPLDHVLSMGLKVEVCSTDKLERYSLDDKDLSLIIHKRREDHCWVYGGSVTLSSNGKRIEINNAKRVFELLRDEFFRCKQEKEDSLSKEVLDVINKKVLENKYN